MGVPDLIHVNIVFAKPSRVVGTVGVPSNFVHILVGPSQFVHLLDDLLLPRLGRYVGRDPVQLPIADRRNNFAGRLIADCPVGP